MFRDPTFSKRTFECINSMITLSLKPTRQTWQRYGLWFPSSSSIPPSDGASDGHLLLLLLADCCSLSISSECCSKTRPPDVICINVENKLYITDCSRAEECAEWTQSYGESPAIWDHSVTCRPTQVNAPRLNPSQTGRCSIYLPQRDRRLSWSWCWLYTEMAYLSAQTSTN